VQSDGVNRQTFSQLMQDPEILGAARHSIDYVRRLARKMPVFRNVYGYEDMLGHRRMKSIFIFPSGLPQEPMAMFSLQPFSRNSICR